MPLEGVGARARLEDAAAQRRRPGPRHGAREPQDLLLRLHRARPGDHRPGPASDAEAADRDDGRRRGGRSPAGAPRPAAAGVTSGGRPSQTAPFAFDSRSAATAAGTSASGTRANAAAPAAGRTSTPDCRSGAASRSVRTREDARGRHGSRGLRLAREAPESRPVRLHVGDVLEERHEARLERRLLGADGCAAAAEGSHAPRSLRRVLRLDHGRSQPREEALALPEDGRLRDDLRDLLEGDAAGRREDEAHRDLDLGEDGDAEASVDGPRERRERLVHGADDPVHRREERLVDLARGEGREEGVEGLERDRAAASRRRARAERAVASLVSGADDPALAGALGFVRLDRGRRRVRHGVSCGSLVKTKRPPSAGSGRGAALALRSPS